MSDFGGEFLSVERRGKIAILTMIKPESMNAIGTHEDCQDIIDTLRTLGDDRSVSAIILTGSGKAFSAGGNLKGMQDRTGIGVLDQPDSTRANYRKGVQAVIRALMDCEVPMIAAVNGHAIGLGADLACTCDIRIAAESAKFACSFIKVGIVPGDGGVLTRSELAEQRQMYVTIFDRLAKLFFAGTEPADMLAAEPAREYEARLGDSELFLTLAFRGFGLHFGPDA